MILINGLPLECSWYNIIDKTQILNSFCYGIITVLKIFRFSAFQETEKPIKFVEAEMAPKNRTID